jgi:hypothetical protein
MSKVEELHHQILDRIGKFAHGELQGYVSWLIIDDLISAAHAEGVAEGEEREKAKIQKRLAASHAEGVAEGEEREKAKIQKRLEAAWESLYPESGVTIDIHESERAKKRHASVLAPPDPSETTYERLHPEVTATVSHYDGLATTSECTLENAGYVERTIPGKKP